MKQSRDGSSLEIYITHTIHVTTTIRTTEEETMPSCIATVSSSGYERHLPPHEYTLIRLSQAEDENILDLLDTTIGAVYEVPSIEKLSDGSLEMVVLKSYCPTLQAMLDKIFPGSNVDLNYDPTEPTVSEVKTLGYNTAKKLCENSFIRRAERMVRHGWPMAANYYAHLTARINGRWRARSHM